MPDAVLAIDQGTTSTRAIVFALSGAPAGQVLATAQRPLPQHYPADGWVEHDPEDIWRATLATTRGVLAATTSTHPVAAIGIANQRETVIVWDRATGVPIYPAIVWQDRRTADHCACLRAEGAEPLVQSRTGLLLDPYFSATKLAWLLDHVEGARTAAEHGRLAAGTIDSFLLWRLTAGAVHATDATNASRTMLFDIHRQCWDDDLLRLFRIPAALLPEVRDNAAPFGTTAPGLLSRRLPITGMAGDQQAALVGQSCLAPGQMKATYGTGAFALCHTGTRPLASARRMLTTIATRLDGVPAYAIEGAIFVAGAALRWLHDGLGLLPDIAASATLAGTLPWDHGVYLVPAFVGLGAPHWSPAARGLLTGLTLDTTPAHLVRAALEAVAYQTHDLVAAIQADGGAVPSTLRIDGGMAANPWLCQFLADILATPVERPAMLEATAWGAALLAALGSSLIFNLGALPRPAPDRFDPLMPAARRTHLLAGWQDAVTRTLPGR